MTATRAARFVGIALVATAAATGCADARWPAGYYSLASINDTLPYDDGWFVITGGFIRLTEDGVVTLGISFALDRGDTTLTASGAYRVEGSTLTLELADPEGGGDPLSISGTITGDTIVIDDQGDVLVFKRGGP